MMKDVHICYTDMGVTYPDGKNLGVLGEHCATQLVIELPPSMTDGIDRHMIVFGSPDGNVLYSNLITTQQRETTDAYRVGNVLYCPLTAVYTAKSQIHISVVGIAMVDGSVTVVDKTPIAYGLWFSESIDHPGNNGSGGIAGDLALLQNMAHIHNNREILDLLSVKNEALYLGSQPINGMLIRRIADDDYRVPLAKEGTLLYWTVGSHGEMYYPYIQTGEDAHGNPIQFKPKWRAGTLWIATPRTWYNIHTIAGNYYRNGGTVTTPDGSEPADIEFDATEIGPSPLPDEGDVGAAAPITDALDRLSIVDGELCVDGTAIRDGIVTYILSLLGQYELEVPGDAVLSVLTGNGAELTDGVLSIEENAVARLNENNELEVILA